MAKLKAGTLGYVLLSQLAVEKGFNVRVDYGDIKGLAKSISENGIKTPLKVHESAEKNEAGEPIYYITGGHRRHKAISSLPNGAELEIPVILAAKDTPEEELWAEVFIENDGQPLNMLEQAELFGRFKDKGMKEAEIARKFGKSQTHVADCMLLLTASPALKKDINTGKVAATVVVEMLKGGSSEEAEVNVEAAKKVSGGKKVTKKHIAKATGKSVGKKAAPKKDEVVVKKSEVAPKPASKPAADVPDKSLAKLEQLQDVLEQQSEPRREHSFKVLKALIAYCKGKTAAKELAEYFFKSEDAQADAAPAAKKSAK